MLVIQIVFSFHFHGAISNPVLMSFSIASSSCAQDPTKSSYSPGIYSVLVRVVDAKGCSS